jgi:uncharacterized protein YdhG (YjbR/CyaY superfamily)
MDATTPATIDDYVAAFPPEIQEKLTAMRTTIRAAAPEAVETISYGMPAFAQNGILVYFAAAKRHIGFYPTAGPMAAFAEFGPYAHSKGAVQFPLDQPLPLDLVDRIVRFRVAEQMAKTAKKHQKRAGASNAQ